MTFVIQEVKKIKPQKINTQNIKAHLEQQEPKYLLVCEKQLILVK